MEKRGEKFQPKTSAPEVWGQARGNRNAEQQEVAEVRANVSYLLDSISRIESTEENAVVTGVTLLRMLRDARDAIEYLGIKTGEAGEGLWKRYQVLQGQKYLRKRIEESTEEAVNNVRDEMSAVTPSILLEQANAQVQDKRLLRFNDINDKTNEGLYELLQEITELIGINLYSFPKIYQDSNFTEIQNAVRQISLVSSSPNHTLLLEAIATVVLGNFSLINEGQVPSAVGHPYENPIEKYFGALEYIEEWMSYQRAQKAPEAPENGLLAVIGRKFENRKRKKEWQAAVSAAVAVQSGLIDHLTDEHSGRKIEINPNERAKTALVMYTPDGRAIETFETITLQSGPLTKFLDLQKRALVIPEGFRSTNVSLAAIIASFSTSLHKNGIAGNGQAETKVVEVKEAEDNFRSVLFPLEEYPNAAVVDHAHVVESIAVLPHLPDSKADLLFRLSIQHKAPYEIDVTAGPTLHTNQNKMLLIPRGDGQAEIGVPSITGERTEEYFRVMTPDTGGERYMERKIAVGEEAAQQAIIVMKPLLTSSFDRDYRAKLLEQDFSSINKHEECISIISEMIMHNSEDAPDLLFKIGKINESQRILLNQSIVILKEKQVQAAEEQARQYRFHDFDRVGLRGGGGLGLGLDVGASGVQSGLYGVTHTQYYVDPLRPPSIVVVHPFGVYGENPRSMIQKLQDFLKGR